MANNKVVFGDQTIIDMTDATVTADTLPKGVKAYDKNGDLVEGTEDFVKWSERKDYVGKNLISDKAIYYTSTTHGITVTREGDTFTLNGTMTANGNPVFIDLRNVDLPSSNMRISSGKEYDANGWNVSLQYRYQQGGALIDFTQNEEVEVSQIPNYKTANQFGIALWAKAGTVFNGDVYKPMLCLASIQDDTYEPYLPNNREIAEKAFNDVTWSEQNVLGAKNLYKNSMMGKTRTNRGVTAVGNADGSITLNGTASGGFASFSPDVAEVGVVSRYDISGLPQNEWIIVSGTKDGSEANFDTYVFINLYNSSGTHMASVVDRGTGRGRCAFKIDGNTVIVADKDTSAQQTYTGITSYAFACGCADGTVVNNITLYPMLRLASIKDNSYAPHAMTNLQLTEKAVALETRIAALEAVPPSYSSVTTVAATMTSGTAYSATLANYDSSKSEVQAFVNGLLLESSEYSITSAGVFTMAKALTGNANTIIIKHWRKS